MTKTKQNNDKNLHWFWRVTTKWWFFPAFSLFLSTLFFLMLYFLDNDRSSIPLDYFDNLFASTFIAIISSEGIDVLLSSILPKPILMIFDGISNYFPLFLIFSAIAIVQYRKNKNIILKGLIITAILLMILNMSGYAFKIINQILTYGYDY